MTALLAVLASMSAPQVLSLRATSTPSTRTLVLIAALVQTHARRALSARVLKTQLKINEKWVHPEPIGSGCSIFVGSMIKLLGG